MKKIKLFSILVIVLFAYPSIYAQNFCMTPSDFSNVLQNVSQYQIVESTYTVRIFFHIIRRTNGTGGQTSAEVETALNVLNSDYAAHGINFSLLGIDEILNNDISNHPDGIYVVFVILDDKTQTIKIKSHENF
jgi:hypothetical protein